MVTLPANGRKTRLVRAAALMDDHGGGLVARIEVQAGLAVPFTLANRDRIHDDRQRTGKVFVIVGFVSLCEAQVSGPAGMETNRGDMQSDGVSASSRVRDINGIAACRQRKLASPGIIVQVLSLSPHRPCHPAFALLFIRVQGKGEHAPRLPLEEGARPNLHFD